MIEKVYRTNCSICNDKFGAYTLDGVDKQFEANSKEKMYDALERNGWGVYTSGLDMQLCPTCKAKFTLIENDVIWNGKQMKLSEFLFKEEIR